MPNNFLLSYLLFRNLSNFFSEMKAMMVATIISFGLQQTDLNTYTSLNTGMSLS